MNDPVSYTTTELSDMARNKDTRPELLSWLAKKHHWLHYLLAANPSIPADAMPVLLASNEVHVRCTLARSAQLTLEEQHDLLSDEKLVREALTENPNLHESVMALLARDRSQDVRAALAIRADISSQLLDKLARGDFRARFYVAGHLTASQKTLSHLARDDEVGVRIQVANNPHADESNLSLLAQDENSAVAIAVNARLHLPCTVIDNLVCHTNVEVRNAVAKRPDLSIEHYRRLLANPDNRKSLSFNQSPTFPVEVMIELVSDEDPHIRSNVYRNLRVPPHVLFKCVTDPEPWVRSQALIAFRGKPADYWREGVKHQGVSLDTLISIADYRSCPLGEFLITSQLHDIYQIIQSETLELKIAHSKMLEPATTTQNHKTAFKKQL